jgi:hypothetical protein
VQRRVVRDLPQRLGAAGAALVEDDDVVVLGIEEAAMHRAGAGAGSAMEEHDRRALRVAALLVVDLVRSADRQIAGRKGFDVRIKLASCHTPLVALNGFRHCSLPGCRFS